MAVVAVVDKGTDRDAECLYLFQYFLRMSKGTAVQDPIASLFGT